jgi:D-threo-aldose 1-dehydrogenase
MIAWEETVEVGTTGLQIPRIGLGTAALGNFLEAMSDDDAIAVIRHALDAGITYFDTAPLYGHGLAERRLRAGIAGIPRDRLVLSTKVGRLLREGAPPDLSQYHEGVAFYKEVPSAGPVWDFSADGVRTSVAESLERMGVERFEILHLHDPDDHFAEASTTGYEGLADLRSRGLVRAIGAGMNGTAVQTALVRACELDVVLCAGRYTLLDQSAMDDLLPACEDRTVSVVVGGVFNSGVLADPSSGALYNYVPAPEDVITRAQAIGAVCARHDVPLAAVALQFPLAHPRVCSVLLGPRTIAELEADLKLLDVDVPDALWADLLAEGLVRSGAPVPAMNRSA